MADYTTSSSSADRAVVSAVAESLCGVADDGVEDACSICLEPFGLQDPATITSCNHEYHLHCILEWSQRSKECPICWQLFNMKDPACQELLNAVEIERRSRKKDHSPTTSRFREERMQGVDDFVSVNAGSGSCSCSGSDSDSDSDDRIMLHLTAMLSRTHYTQTREKQSLSPIHVLASPADMSHHSLIRGPSNGASTSSGSASQVDVRLSASKGDNDGEPPSKPSVLSGQTLSGSLRRATSSELFSFPKIKSKWSSTSARYKESISKSTLEIKEKLLSHNNSVNELSRGVKREMLAGMSSICRMIERLDLTPRSDAPLSYVFCSAGVTSKGKNVRDGAVAELNAELNAHNSISKVTPAGSTSVIDVSEADF